MIKNLLMKYYFKENYAQCVNILRHEVLTYTLSSNQYFENRINYTKFVNIIKNVI